MPKKIISIALILIFLTAITGCSSNKGGHSKVNHKKAKYNKSRNGGARINARGSMRNSR